MVPFLDWWFLGADQAVSLSGPVIQDVQAKQTLSSPSCFWPVFYHSSKEPNYSICFCLAF
ncbi:hypothetical protein T4D_4073 [Trichinella pseudospiralis]|uniref:Uncharacterized protein n=1 Tax=Trichinella pseudospiralis TaxID=6337 RepID=A0A0V1E2I4_TRIPS|nr:hypothetical protein T4D_4073 [Trichinella pseudospiralis]